MSPLADAVYAVLRRHVQQSRSPHPVLPYKGLCDRLVGFKVGPRSGALHAALGEIVLACRAARLGAIAAVVINGTTKIPGHGYFPVAHPAANSDADRAAAWSAEVRQVVKDAATYPSTLA